MTKEELRIGNWLWRPCCNDKVVEIRENGIIGSDRLRGVIPFSEIEPIPLTNDVLLKCGFRQLITASDVYVVTTDISSVVYYANACVADIRTENDRASITCKNLHQLQNAYRVVTNNELPIHI